ncbi:MAG: hypothetical protein PHQ23_08660, partial [Candidatus Wallbacteria bacterium]|nr:hypothetical protein [Candidatus Wallbacteria bacterium]
MRLKFIHNFFLYWVIFTISAGAAEIPAGHESYDQLSALAEAAGISEITRSRISSRMNKGEMAGLLAKILIDNSYVELEDRNGERSPLFIKLRTLLPELRSICYFLRDELKKYYQIDQFYLEQEFSKLERNRSDNAAGTKHSVSVERERDSKVQETYGLMVNREKTHELVERVPEPLSEELEEELKKLSAERMSGKVQEANNEVAKNKIVTPGVGTGEVPINQLPDLPDHKLQEILELENRLKLLIEERKKVLSSQDSGGLSAETEQKPLTGLIEAQDGNELEKEKKGLWLFEEEMGNLDKELEEFQSDMIIESIFQSEIAKRTESRTVEVGSAEPSHSAGVVESISPGMTQEVQVHHSSLEPDAFDEVQNREVRTLLDSIRKDINRRIAGNSEQEIRKYRKSWEKHNKRPEVEKMKDSGPFRFEDMLDKVEKDLERIERKIEERESGSSADIGSSAP